MIFLLVKSRDGGVRERKQIVELLQLNSKMNSISR